MNSEKQRLVETQNKTKNWKKWGSYLSERQWGTVREDYSTDGEAWDYITHEKARSYAYRWGEEGIGGISDDMQRLCFSVALWNKKDPILKERLFGLNGNEGNHGEDVKEYYYYLDNTPTHSYMKMLYKYPINEFPYNELIRENSKRNRKQSEYELIDTGIFDNDEYFDIFVEYAKKDYNDIFIKITAINRSNKPAELNLIPQIWLRNTWSWKGKNNKQKLTASPRSNSIEIKHNKFKNYKLYYSDNPELLYCDNETNFDKVHSLNNTEGYFKDGINNYIVNQISSSINPNKIGTKAGLNYNKIIPRNDKATIFLRLTNINYNLPFDDIENEFHNKVQETDHFYGEIQKNNQDEEKCKIQRQAFAGMLWNKQFYYYDVEKWFEGDSAYPKPSKDRKYIRNGEWKHLNNADIISMPDTWEYPWYATWDSAFHMIPFAMIDPDYAKEQLVLFTREWYMHANGQLPAYEWNFGDVNPPVHAWSAWRVFKIDAKQNNKPDYQFLERIFHKLLINFTWWVNRKDEDGHNIFQGGFLGLDNIGVFNRSKGIPSGGHIDQSDGTSWMAMYSLNMLRIALELSKINPIYQDTATKFFEHFLHIAEAMNNIGDEGIGLWDEEDEFYYDVLHDQNKRTKLKIRSIVG